jgi:O-antigen/teichoic acid export membrane protein
VWPVFRLGGVRRHVTYGGALATSRLAWQVINQSDVLIAGRFLTPCAVGLYSVSLHLATLPMQRVMTIVNQMVFPAVARLQAEAVHGSAGLTTCRAARRAVGRTADRAR